MRQFTRYFSPDVIKATLGTTSAVYRLDIEEKHLLALERSEDVEEEMMGIKIDAREPKDMVKMQTHLPQRKSNFVTMDSPSISQHQRGLEMHRCQRRFKVQPKQQIAGKGGREQISCEITIIMHLYLYL